MRDGNHGKLLLRQCLFDPLQLRPSADGRLQLGDIGTVKSQAVCEAVAKVSRVQEEDVLALLDQVRRDQIPTKSARSRDDKRLRAGVGRLEQFPQHRKRLAKDGDKTRSNVTLAVDTDPSRLAVSNPTPQTIPWGIWEPTDLK